jgi:enoyl-CoA hydratase/carnithine racemase
LSVTLPAAVGGQHAAELLYTGRRITGDDAAAIGLVDRVVPLAVQSIRATLRGDLADRVAAATDHELAEQERLRRTADFREGTRAMSERRPPRFTGVE